jgi:hypothetical protein
MYVNMIISEWQMSFETKALGETRLRAISREMFDGAVGRQFWRTARAVRIATSETRAARLFHEILDEEYQRVLASPAVAPLSDGDGVNDRGKTSRIRRALGWVAAGAGTAAALWVLRSSRRR